MRIFYYRYGRVFIYLYTVGELNHIDLERNECCWLVPGTLTYGDFEA